MTSGKGAGSILAETDEEWHYRVAVGRFKATYENFENLTILDMLLSKNSENF